ncbi:hypothetical protein C8R46DRAFT_1136055 [Mycena filopes]|nr:hypothetical protein C8R46DRAFT_1136055 [Mycena filopes]
MSAVHSLVAKKLCRETVRALKDIGVDVLQLGCLDEVDPPFDYDGLDFLAATMLVGISGWFEKLDEQGRPLQPWYDSLRQVLQLLRAPRSVDLLPLASAYAIDPWEALLPLRSKSAELNVTARCEDGDASVGENTVVDWNPETPLASVTGDLLGVLDNANEEDSVSTPEFDDGEPPTAPSTSAEHGSEDQPPDSSTPGQPASEETPMDEVDIDPRAHAEQSETREDSAAQDPRAASEAVETNPTLDDPENTEMREIPTDAPGDAVDGSNT